MRASEEADEVVRVGERAEDAEAAGRVRSRLDLVAEPFGRLFTAPDVRVGDEEDLLGRVALQAGQSPLAAVLGRVGPVGPVGLAHAAVIGDVLALRRQAVHLERTQTTQRKKKTNKRTNVAPFGRFESLRLGPVRGDWLRVSCR